MKKIINALVLLYSNPRRFSKLVRNKFLVPSNAFTRFIRGLYCAFVPNKLASSEGNPDRLLLIYDTLSNPVTFDFLHILFNADWHRRQAGKTYLDVLIVYQSNRFFVSESYSAAVGEDGIDWRINNLLVPLCRLFSSLGRIYLVEQEEALEIVKGYQNIQPEEYSYSNFKTVLVRGDDPDVSFYPALTTADTARKIVDAYIPQKDNRLIVTITLRTYDYIPARNSDIESWVDFAGELDPVKYRVVFIPDASTHGVEAIEQLNGFEVFDPACWNIQLRAALYRRAWTNMGVACGPLAISGLMENVWTIMIDRTLDYPKRYAEDLISNGHFPGKVPTFYSKHCHYHLGKDDKQTILDTFNKYAKKNYDL
ncbi:hypothetical protein N8Z86_03065 [Amylibacter sp.]|nr:hypothetical protein [Amylibacter sp.]